MVSAMVSQKDGDATTWPVEAVFALEFVSLWDGDGYVGFRGGVGPGFREEGNVSGIRDLRLLPDGGFCVFTGLRARPTKLCFCPHSCSHFCLYACEGRFEEFPTAVKKKRADTELRGRDDWCFPKAGARPFSTSRWAEA
ncbi:hypothetical protein NDU88_000142 [Pleurodeles waltl]|uniref:Uncharacterized protein n=1 Tax=Pleurodeles waltl TaxID=8319 RepID=A0AAV7S3P7_PLEWA|nr:hypothetical protein NDU88_000142 [Pleurodeles waltl]